MRDKSIRKYMDISERKLKKIIESTWKRAIRDQLIKIWSHILKVIIRIYAIKNCLQNIWKTKVVVMMESNQPVATNVDSAKPTKKMLDIKLVNAQICFPDITYLYDMMP